MSLEFNQFDFSKYDKGGKGAKAGDFKLTGDEIKMARRDGWDIKLNSTFTVAYGTPDKLVEDQIVVPMKPMSKQNADEIRTKRAEVAKKHQVEILLNKAKSMGISEDISFFEDLIKSGVRLNDISISKDVLSIKMPNGNVTTYKYSKGKMVGMEYKEDSYDYPGQKEYVKVSYSDVKNGKYRTLTKQQRYLCDPNGKKILIYSSTVGGKDNRIYLLDETEYSLDGRVRKNTEYVNGRRL